MSFVIFWIVLLLLQDMAKHLYIIAGCNGAGKTTASITLLPKSLQVKEFVNADEIAKGLSPFNPEGVAFEAGRLMLKRIDELLDNGEDFSIETTLATRSYVNLVKKAQARDYLVHILFFWLDNVGLAKKRVASRVAMGGHNISPDVIERRYFSGLRNFFELFINEVDIWAVYDNSNNVGDVIAIGGKWSQLIVLNKSKFDKMKNYERERD